MVPYVRRRERRQRRSASVDGLFVRRAFHEPSSGSVGRMGEAVGQAGPQDFAMSNAAGSEVDFLRTGLSDQGVVDVPDQCVPTSKYRRYMSPEGSRSRPKLLAAANRLSVKGKYSKLCNGLWWTNVRMGQYCAMTSLANLIVPPQFHARRASRSVWSGEGDQRIHVFPCGQSTREASARSIRTTGSAVLSTNNKKKSNSKRHELGLAEVFVTDFRCARPNTSCCTSSIWYHGP